MDEKKIEDYTRDELSQMIKRENLEIQLRKQYVSQLNVEYSKKCAKEAVVRAVAQGLSKLSEHTRELAK